MIEEFLWDFVGGINYVLQLCCGRMLHWLHVLLWVAPIAMVLVNCSPGFFFVFPFLPWKLNFLLDVVFQSFALW
ncbi:hypothetical protein RchiOBHm_Chr6g0276081 [Rosa chinensis]|uniref:Uncharacterized protein n=1 Tax=Rosa chinensis TaxID=74649 RepID=A0A2P6PS76_ROSCH|nr:hypothetical protein RchiOBHm_Chr6g0276081 [Rosa chinensis]